MRFPQSGVHPACRIFGNGPSMPWAKNYLSNVFSETVDHPSGSSRGILRQAAAIAVVVPDGPVC